MENIDSKHKVKVARRKQERDIKKTLGNDFNKYLAEIVTNADDSYKRLEESKSVDLDEIKSIAIEIKKGRRKGDQCVVSVIDNAEGFSIDRIKAVFLEYGGDNAGGSEVKSRGIFGQGASDVLFSAAYYKKTAILESIKNNVAIRVKFTINEETLERFLVEDVLHLSKSQLEQIRTNWGIQQNGTRVTFGIPDKIDLKNRAKVIDELEKFYMFRYLFAASNREITLKYYNEEKVVLSSKKFLFDTKTPLLNNRNFDFNYDEQKVDCRLSLYKNENKAHDETQIIVKDEHDIVYDNTLFKYETYPQLTDISGELVIPSLYEICRRHLNSEERDAILLENRDGLDTKNPFYKALQVAINPILIKFINDNTEKLKEKEITSNKKFSDALDKLNKALNQEIDEPISGGLSKGVNPPSDGIRFVRPQISITIDRGYDLKLLINAKMVPSGSEIVVTCATDEYLEWGPKIITYELNESNEEGLVVKSIYIKGIKKTETEIPIKCEFLEYSTTSLVNVVEEEVHYPQNGIQFFPDKVTISPNATHTAHLFIDGDIIPVDSEIHIKELSGNLKFDCSDCIFSQDKLMSDQIGVIEIKYYGGIINSNYTIIATSGPFSTELKVECRLQKNSKNGQVGLIAGIKLIPGKVYYQSYFDLSTNYIVIMEENQINLTMMGSMQGKSQDKPNFNKEQTKYLCDLISYEVGKISVNKQIESGKIFIGQEGHEEYLKQLQIRKNKYFALIYESMTNG